MGEVTNVQMYSPEIVTGYIMLFNVAEDSYSPLHQSTWAGLLKSRITRLSGRRPPSWSIGMIEASLFLEVDFSEGPRLVSGTSDAAPFFDRLVAAVRDRNPVLERPGNDTAEGGLRPAPGLEALVERHLPELVLSDESLKTALPGMARSSAESAKVAAAVQEVSSDHRIFRGDARDLSGLAERSIHLVVTSPPYWTLKEYNEGEHQLGAVADYEQFVAELGRVWSECHRVLVPGGRLVIIVGDVCLSRRQHGRHVVVPLHASIQESCRRLGFDNLAPIIWHKIANANFEMGSAGGFLGKPYEPNAVIKNDIEFILMQRKPGGYRSPSPAARALSVISADRPPRVVPADLDDPGRFHARPSRALSAGAGDPLDPNVLVRRGHGARSVPGDGDYVGGGGAHGKE